MRTSEIKSAENIIRLETQQEGRELENALIVSFIVPDAGNEDVVDREVPRKTLLNAVGDLCRTR